MRRFLPAMLLAAAVVAYPATDDTVEAHSGGTDKYGCHSGSQPYHCHGSGVSADTLKEYKLNGLTSKGVFKVVAKRHKSCASLNRSYLRGVARSTKGALFHQLVSRSLYTLNKHLDTNKNGIACGLLEPENSRVKTFACPKEAATGTEDGLTRETAYRCSTSHSALKGWLVEVLSRTPNANLVVRSENHGNDPPGAGYQFYMVKIRATNLTGATSSFESMWIEAEGESGRTYRTYEDYCGVFPNLFISLNTRPGKSVTGNLCWKVLASDAASLRLYYSYKEYCNCNMYDFFDKRVYVAIS